MQSSRRIFSFRPRLTRSCTAGVFDSGRVASSALYTFFFFSLPSREFSYVPTSGSGSQQPSPGMAARDMYENSRTPPAASSVSMLRACTTSRETSPIHNLGVAKPDMITSIVLVRVARCKTRHWGMRAPLLACQM